MRPARWKGWKLAAPSSALQSTWWKRLKWRLLWGARLLWRCCMEREGSISMGRGGSWDRSIVNWDLVVGWSREVGVFESQKRWKQQVLLRCLKASRYHCFEWRWGAGMLMNRRCYRESTLWCSMSKWGSARALLSELKDEVLTRFWM